MLATSYGIKYAYHKIIKINEINIGANNVRYNENNKGE